LKREKRDWELVTLRQSEEIQDDMQRAARHLLQAREHCPLLPATHLLLAELSPFIPWLGDEEGHLMRMRNLISTDDRLLMESGFVEFQSGRVDNALADWKRVAEHSPQQFLPQILEYAVQSPELTSEIEKLLPDDPASLVELAKSRFAGREGTATRERLLARARQLLTTAEATPERHYLEGMILSLEGNSPPAIEQLKKAVELRPEQIGWRYELALVLQRSEKLEAAHEQARLCWSLDPSNELYEKLYRQLVRMQLTTR
jgi:tetratricopeptide (TPR) repeat protein